MIRSDSLRPLSPAAVDWLQDAFGAALELAPFDSLFAPAPREVAAPSATDHGARDVPSAPSVQERRAVHRLLALRLSTDAAAVGAVARRLEAGETSEAIIRDLASQKRGGAP